MVYGVMVSRTGEEGKIEFCSARQKSIRLIASNLAFRLLKFIIRVMQGKVKRFKVLVTQTVGATHLILFIAAFVLYLRTMPPTVLGGDSAEYQHMAYYLGVPHSTGYPLYILLAKLFTFLPFGDVAFRVTLFSVVCAALTVPLVYAAALRLTRSPFSSILAAGGFALAPSFWGAAIDAEVYALHLLLGVLSILFALRWHQDGNPRDSSTTLRINFYALAFCFGLGLTNHRVIVFVAPALALVVWLNRARLNFSTLWRGALLVLLPLLLYAYIPIRAGQLIAQQDPANWEFYQREDAIVKGQISAYYRHTPDGFFNLVTGFDNRNKLGFKSPLDEANRLELASTLLAQQFNVVGIALIVIGGVASLRRDRKTFAIIFALAASVGFIAIYLRGESTVYYFSLAYFALALWLAFGIDVLMTWARASKLTLTSPRVVASVLCLLPLSSLLVNFPRMDKSDLFTFRDFAQTVLRDNLAPNAVVIAPWEVSEPMRYYQFVEHQRDDLLVVNVSPIWVQFDRMIARARELKRPFYYVQFEPESKNTPGYRWVQAVPLPMLTEPRPRYPLSNARTVPQVQVVGFELEPDPPQPGTPVHVLIYYDALERMYPMYSSLLSVTDLAGNLIGEFKSFPGSRYFPTYRWYEIGNYYRDAYSFVLPADAPAGLYQLDLYWYEYDLTTQTSNFEKEFHAALGTVRFGDLAAENITHPKSIRVGEAITFLGWSGNTEKVARGQALNLDLFWRTERELKEAYSVFVHLVDADGQVVANADSAPASGLFPTNRWTPGEGTRDRHILNIPADLAPGNYTIEIGMYLPATNARLRIDSSDKIVLTQVNVQ